MRSQHVLLSDPPALEAGAAPESSPTLEEIYDLYGARVFRRAQTLLRDPDWARDTTQEVFLRAAQNFVRVRTHPLPWLFRVTNNLCLNNLRDNRRRGQLLANRRLPLECEPGSDVRVAVNQLLARVPEDLQVIVIYYYVDDLSHDDIAGILGVSRRTIGNRLAAFQTLVGELFAREGIA
jgi:RNA polymerase sigma factor (sigma-70 family)